MIFELIKDMQRAIAAMPDAHPGRRTVELLSNALTSCTEGLLERPEHSTQTIVNQLRQPDIAPHASDLIDAAERRLDSGDLWLRAEHGIATVRQWQDIVAVSPERGIFHRARKPGEIVDCRIGTHELVDLHRFDTVAYVAVVAHPVRRGIAVVAADGAVEAAGLSRPILLRSRSNCFGFFGEGFVGVDRDDRLVYYDRSGSEHCVLQPDMPSVGCNIVMTPDARAAVVLAGDRPGRQRVLVLRSTPDGGTHCRRWRVGEALVTAAGLGREATWLVLATLDRRLLLYREGLEAPVASGQVSGSPGRPFDVVRACALTTETEEFAVAFADSEGGLGLWLPRRDSLTRLGEYHALRDVDDLTHLSWMPGEQTLLVATTTSLRAVNVEEPVEAVRRPAIGHCSIADDGWVAYACPQARQLGWLHDGHVVHEFAHPNLTPHSIASTGGGSVVVGTQGGVVQFGPDREPGADDGLDIFVAPVVAVLPWDATTIAAVCESGEVKLVRPAEEWVEPIHPPIAHWKQAGACLRGNRQQVICWGREQAGGSASRVFVLDSNGVNEVVVDVRGVIRDVTYAPIGDMIHVLLDDGVTSYRQRAGAWRPWMQRAADADCLAAVGDALLAVFLAETDWVELWSTRKSLATVSAAYMPVTPTCTDTNGSSIALGSASGEFLVLGCRGRTGVRT